MDLLAPITRHVIAPLWAKHENIAYLDEYRRVLKTQFEPEAIAEANQQTRVLNMMRYAYQHVPFWTGRFTELGIEDVSNLSFEVLQQLPLLTKRDLQNHHSDLISTEVDCSALIAKNTSGSTGTSVTVLLEESRQTIYRACVLRADEWSGWRLGERKACIWGNPEHRTDWKGKLRRTILERDFAYLDTLKMGQKEMNEFTDTLIRTPTSMLFGHANSLYVFADFIRTQRPEADIKPNGIISTCMVLHDFERALIEQTFDCKVTNRYGCEEVGLIACECEEHQGLHVNTDCVLVEILDDDDQPCEPGKPGRVVVTDTTNFAMPMIRYEVGDMATWATEPCGCRRTLPLLSKIEGRVADYVVTESGDYISGISLTENFAVKIPGVAQMQIIQEEVNHFTFNVVRGHDFGDNSLNTLDEMSKATFSPNVTYDVVYMDQIPREKSGKFRFCISRVPKRWGQAKV